jgi:hypothetical protein
MNALTDLTAQWRADADVLESYADLRVAEVCRRHATQLEIAFHAWHQEPLTLREASLESGYPADSLRRLIRDGSLSNVAGQGPPMVRRCDLPKKPTGRGVYSHTRELQSREQIVRSVADSVKGVSDG